MVIQHNLPAMNSRRAYNKNRKSLSKSLEKLSSGYKINRAGDDAAGLAVSEKMRSQIAGMKQAVVNSQDGISLIQTFEGALGETVALIHRAKSLADQMANGSYDDEIDRRATEVEYLHLCDEIDQIAETDFNGVVMLTGGSVPQWLENAVNEPEIAKAGTVYDAAANIAMKTAAASSANAAPIVKTVTYAAAANRAGGVACGDFTVYGNSSDFSFDTSSGVLTILGGDVTVEGTGAATQNTIVVAKDMSANVTLKNVNIDVSRTDNACAFKIEDDSKGNVTVTLEGDNMLKSGNGCAGLQKNGDVNSGTLTINGNGSLYVHGGDWKSGGVAGSAGIGGAVDETSANIIISGGQLRTFGGRSGGAGIGGGDNGSGTNITILDGTVFALGGSRASGIGGGSYGEGRNITISGGTIIANSTSWGAGIGGGENADGVNITISSGVIVAQGCGGCGAGIGGGNEGNGIGITISGGNVVAKSHDACLNGRYYYGGAGIGGGGGHIYLNPGGKGDVIIKGNETVVMAEGGTDAEDIGSGASGPSSVVIIDDILTTEPYTGDKIVNGALYRVTNGTIVHYTGKTPTLPTPPKPDDDGPPKPDIPDNSEKLKVSTRPSNGEAKLTYTDNLVLQVGARTKDAVRFTFAYDSDGIGDLKADLNCTAAGLGMDALTLTTQEQANYAIDRLDHALNKVSLIRGTFGAAQNRLEHKIDNLNNSVENLTSAESTIRDTDMAVEMMKFTKEQILSQSAQAMLTQANSLPQGVMSLISG